MITRIGQWALLVMFLALGVVIAPAAADARGDNVLTFRLGLNVPTICRIDVRGPLPAASGEATTAEEFCNAPAGYRVVALHAVALKGGPVWFDYGGRRVVGSATGMTTLAEEPTAAHRQRSFAVFSPGQGAPALSSVTLQIVPR